ncbi:Uma2 family endonuclease [Microbispora sp. NBC_01189]|uniref:Uma2 family endonuclease n=1 Tax=Microbispora sp. NBC_01189 TaxID=2903583 RepID=UPI002E0DC256|nr:Uma2 family endonuclease [Microbispora sp. NBC_01189]
MGHEPQETGKPDDLDGQLLRLCLELNEADYRAEIHNGQVVVGLPATRQHCEVLDRLANLLYTLKLRNRWRFFYSWGVHIPPQPNLRLPDLMVLPDRVEGFDEMRAYGHSLLLVVEVCSPGTHGIDWKEKPLDYARAGVPLFLIVDPLATPRRVTLMSDPLSDLEPFDYHRQPYRKVVTAEEGEVLELPEPFGIKIETSALFD